MSKKKIKQRVNLFKNKLTAIYSIVLLLQGNIEIPPIRSEDNEKLIPIFTKLEIKVLAILN